MAVLKIGKLALNGIPRLAASVTDTARAREVLHAKGRPDLVEIRIDLFADAEKSRVVGRILPFRGKTAVLATIRSRREGGAWKGTEKQRLELFLAVLPWVDAVDIEASSSAIVRKVVRAARRRRKTVMISFHDFKRMPRERQLRALFKKARGLGADVVKIAARARTAGEIRRLAAFTVEHADKNIVAIAMGREASLSRVLFPALGSLITYAPWGRATAPGQFDYATTRSLLKKFYPDFAA